MTDLRLRARMTARALPTGAAPKLGAGTPHHLPVAAESAPQNQAPDTGGDTIIAETPSHPTDRLLAAPDVAALFGRTLRTLFNWERRGILVPVRMAGRRFYRVADIAALTSGSGRAAGSIFDQSISGGE